MKLFFRKHRLALLLLILLLLFFLLLVRIAFPGDRHNVSYSGPLCGHTKGVPFAFDFAALLLELDLDVDT